MFVSRNTLRGRAKLPPCAGAFALDSGGFTELQRFGRWSLTESEYVAFVRAVALEYGGRFCWAAPQDWMCEPVVLTGGVVGGAKFAGTRLSVEEHQRLTVENFVRLRRELGGLVVPVLQGWKVADYWRCQEMYADAGVRLGDEKTVAVGSVCRRQNSSEAAAIMETLAVDGLRLHGFGFKKQGVLRCAGAMASSDSMAWSYAGRKRPNENHGHVRRSREPGARGKVGAADDCANCLEYALEWRADLLGAIEEA